MGSGEPSSILVVDDAPAIRQMLMRILKAENSYRLDEAFDGEAAKLKLAEQSFDLVITDLNMPRMGGLELMEWALERDADTAWIILSGYGTFETAVRAIHLGAFSFVAKPLESRTAFCVTVRNALEQKRLQDEKRRLSAALIEANEKLHARVGQLEAACRILGDQAEVIREDLERAERIQRALLPRSVPSLPGFSAAAMYRPSQSIGGDLYDLFRLDDERVAFVLADAAGHGVSAAMLSVLFKTRLQQLFEVEQVEDPARVLRRLNSFLCEECASPGLFITAALGVFDVRAGAVRFASAGHPPVIVRHQGGGIEMLYHTGPALGLAPGAKYAETQIRFKAGARLLCYTDGLYHTWPAERSSPSDVIAQILSEAQRPAPEVLEALLAASVRRCVGSASDDDRTLLLIAAEDAPSSLDHEAPSTAQDPSSGAAHPFSESTILVGVEREEAMLSVEGRGSWTASGSFYTCATDEIRRGHAVTVDLSCCSYLDSTFLGTMHEVVTYADQRGVPVQLQGVLGSVLDEFCELGMDRVLRHMSPSIRPLPTHMDPLRRSEEDERGSRDHLLRAHEALAGLSEENRVEFQQLIDALRAERNASAIK